MLKVYRIYRVSFTPFLLKVRGKNYSPAFASAGTHYELATRDKDIQDALENNPKFNNVYFLVSVLSAGEESLGDGNSSDCSQLREENTNLKAENEQLKTENESLKVENTNLKAENEQLKLSGGNPNIEDATGSSEGDLESVSGVGQDNKDDEDGNVDGVLTTLDTTEDEDSKDDGNVNDENVGDDEFSIVEEVKTLQEARAYLKSKGITIANTSKTGTVLATAEANKIRFPNLK